MDKGNQGRHSKSDSGRIVGVWLPAPDLLKDRDFTSGGRYCSSAAKWDGATLAEVIQRMIRKKDALKPFNQTIKLLVCLIRMESENDNKARTRSRKPPAKEGKLWRTP